MEEFCNQVFKNPLGASIPKKKKKKIGLSAGYLAVVEGVYEGGEASGLVLQTQLQNGNVADEYGVKDLSHRQVITCSQRLDNK